MAEQLRGALQERETRGTRIGASALMDQVDIQLGQETRFTLTTPSLRTSMHRWAVGLAAALAVMLVVGGTALGIRLFTGTGNWGFVDQPITTVIVPTMPAATTPQTTTTLGAASTISVPEAGWVYDPALSGEERVALVSEWAGERNLLTGADVVAALGESKTKLVDAASPEVANYPDYWGFGFLSPFPGEEAALDLGATYVLQKEGVSRNVIIYVSEYVTYGPAIREMYANIEAGEGGRNAADERYDPAPIGIAAFAYETNGGSGALDRLVMVDTGEALVVVVASPASPNYPEANLTVGENLTREQVDNLVRVAVEKVSGGIQ
ncbi:MAG: hypothetical protein OEX97_11505 [Acidimicrobiia bacterium]|nr:hypothetical protein [Acidimicrobiia bacterium]